MAKTALDAKRGNLFYLDPDEIVVVGWDTADGSEHPLYDERAKLPVDEKLVANIVALQRIIHPIRVRKNGDKVEVVVGRQRVKACRVANQRLRAAGCEPVFVPAIIDRPSAEQALGMLVSENEIREGDSPMVRARKIQRYLGLGRSDAEAGAVFGLTPAGIRQQLTLLDLDTSVQKLVEGGKMAPTAAVGLAKLPRAEQKGTAEKLLAEGKATIAAVQTEVKKARTRKRGRDEDEVTKAPGKRLILKIIASNNALEGDKRLSEEFIRGMRFAVGDLPESAIKGLRAVIAGIQ